MRETDYLKPIDKAIHRDVSESPGHKESWTQADRTSNALVCIIIYFYINQSGLVYDINKPFEIVPSSPTARIRAL